MEETNINEIDQINEMLSICRDIDLNEFPKDDIELLKNDLNDKKIYLSELLEKLYKEDQTANSGKISMIETMIDDLDNLLEDFSKIIDKQVDDISNDVLEESFEEQSNEENSANELEEDVSEIDVSDDIVNDQEETLVEDVEENILEENFEEQSNEENSANELEEDVSEIDVSDDIVNDQEETLVENVEENIIEEQQIKETIEEVQMDDNVVQNLPTEEIKSENTIVLTNIPSEEYRQLSKNIIEARRKTSNEPLDAVKEGERISNSLMRDIYPTSNKEEIVVEMEKDEKIR